jgi:hypothetical protein
LKPVFPQFPKNESKRARENNLSSETAIQHAPRAQPLSRLFNQNSG